MKIFRLVKRLLWKLGFLIRADAPFWAIKSFLMLNLTQRIIIKHSDTERFYIRKREEFRFVKQKLKLDNDWFTGHIPTWLRALDSTTLRDKDSINCLEIGSWQGLSAYFLLSELPNAHLVCVDTWVGGDEHKAWEAADEHKDGANSVADVVASVESTFDANLSEFKDRMVKYKGTSISYYDKNFESGAYDLIYVDGSHHSDDVVVDAFKCFEMLNIDGLLIFDDYFWNHYARAIENPAGAINTFLRLKRHQLEIVCFDYQVVVRKISKSVRWME